ncbi:hypothetical protein DEU56DRAFT_962919 [Suillus clintonianus]|uniref:uncharacterized protein n=1 Tax=Suillus clintonianus TaxID=1904413 RepID=UPI001B86A74A|nr:uncharacterized protein DEU56DRAFT_962919 [Suillus clintonianus]KAG2125128.1 hypothetical protein DEU56DRAFT_962919 [Suillus clintonianus]
MHIYSHPIKLSFPPIRGVNPSLKLNAAVVHICDNQDGALIDSLADCEIAQKTDVGHNIFSLVWPAVRSTIPETEYRIITTQWEAVVADICNLQGFSWFLLPPSYEDLQAAARHGPESPIADLEYLKDRFARAIPQASKMGLKQPWNDLIVLLRAVWDDVMLPIVKRQSRIWLCPTTTFTFIPLHAAHLFRTRADRSGKEPSREMMKNPATPSFVAVGQGQPGGGKGKALLSVDSELELVHKLIPATDNCSTLLGDAATRADEPEPPTLLDIMEKDILHAEFAFLLACHTAVGDKETPDEVIHLAAAEIRNLQAFLRFLLPPSYTESQVAAHGPVIILIASEYSCGAIIVSTSGEPHHVRFLRITLPHLETLKDDFATAIRHTARMRPEEPRKKLRVLLRTVWDKIMLSIVNVPQHDLKLRCQSKIWLCLTAAFTFIPLHAANPFRMNADRSGRSRAWRICHEDVRDSVLRSNWTKSTGRRARRRAPNVKILSTRPILTCQEFDSGATFPYQVDYNTVAIVALRSVTSICNSTTENQNSMCHTSMVNHIDGASLANTARVKDGIGARGERKGSVKSNFHGGSVSFKRHTDPSLLICELPWLSGIREASLSLTVPSTLKHLIDVACKELHKDLICFASYQHFIWAHDAGGGVPMHLLTALQTWWLAILWNV